MFDGFEGFCREEFLFEDRPAVIVFPREKKPGAVPLLKCEYWNAFPVLEEENKKLFQAARSFDSVRRFSGLIALSGNVSMDVGEMLFDYLRMIFHIDLLAYRFIINQIKGKEADLKTMVESMGYAESCLAIASYRESLPYYSVPVLEKRETPFVQTRALYHPLVEGAVANDLPRKSRFLSPDPTHPASLPF